MAETYSPASTSLSLIRRAQRADADAWTRLVAIYGPLIYGWCRQSSLSEHDAADVTQEVFRSLYTALPRYTAAEGRFRHWLRGMARNHLREYFRRESRHIEAIPGNQGELADLETVDYIFVVADGEAQSEVHQIVHRALDTIRPLVATQTWQAFWKTVIDCETVEQVSNSLGISRDAVRQARCRVLRRLRNELADEFASGD